MAHVYMVTAITYIARQDGNQNGMIKNYEAYLSLDGNDWGRQPVVMGEFKNTTALQTATLKTPTAGRYLKLIANSEINGRAWTSAAEIGIEASSDITGIDDVRADAPFSSAAALYDLQGRRLAASSPLPRGIYIQGGKKVMR